jgi:hypothetical protein
MVKYSDEYIKRRVKWYYECWDYVEKADYQKATACAKKGLKLYPDDTRKKDIFKHIRQVFDYAFEKGYIKERPYPKNMKFKLNQKMLKTLNEN